MADNIGKDVQMHPNIYKKLQKCRVELQKTTIKKSGKNDFSHYDYHELSDFLPQVNELEHQNGLTAIFNYTPELATLTIIDTDKLEDTIVFSTPIEVTQLKGCNGMQNIGGTQTFARRYLYMMDFEISENDIVNKNEVDEEKQFQQKKIDKIKVETIKEMLKKTNSDEKSFCDFFKVKSVGDITNSLFVKCMDTLEEKLNRIEKAKKADELEGVI
jgi:hypothetical protein